MAPYDKAGPEHLVVAAIKDRGISDNLAAVTSTINQLTASGKHLESKSLQHKQYLAAEATLDLIIESANTLTTYLRKNRQSLISHPSKHSRELIGVSVCLGANWDRMSSLCLGKRQAVSLWDLKKTIFNALRSTRRLLRAAEHLIEEKGPKAAQERLSAALKELEKAS